jgi:stage II sporulation protein M
MKRKKKVNEKKRPNKKVDLWQESLTYLKEARNYIYFVVILFFISAIIGFAFPGQFVFFNELLKDLSSQIEGKGLLGLTWFILQNNVLSAFMAMIFGVVLGIMPIISVLINGTLLGYVYNLVSAESGFGVIIFLLPHGIFELPAVLISLGLGVYFGMFIFARRGKKKKEFLRRFWSSLKVFLTVVLPLLVVAAIIEGLLIYLTG